MGLRVCVCVWGAITRFCCIILNSVCGRGPYSLLYCTSPPGPAAALPLKNRTGCSGAFYRRPPRKPPTCSPPPAPPRKPLEERSKGSRWGVQARSLGEIDSLLDRSLTDMFTCGSTFPRANPRIFASQGPLGTPQYSRL